MIRRLFVYTTVLGCIAFAWPRAVEAQGCYPANNPTISVTNFQVLAPSQVPFAAVTLTVSALNGSQISHKMELGVGDESGVAALNWASWNAANLDLYYQIDNGTRELWDHLSNNHGFNGSYPFPFPISPNWVGHILNLYLVGTEKPGSGSFSTTTQDIVSIVVTNQAPGIYYSDGNDSNIYWEVTTNYIGIPQISFADCPAMRTAHHTPSATLQLQNVSSGELRNTVSTAGPTVSAGNSVQASAVDYISALPGATLTGSYGGITFCDVDNINFFGLQSLFRIEGAKVIVADLGHPPRVGSEKPVPSSIYDVAPICQGNCDPPDWEPTVVHSFAGRHPYWIGECQLLRAPDVNGVPWIPLCSFLTDASGAFGAGLVPSTIQLAAGGLALPYPGPAPLLPIPGKCTKYPVNVLFTVGPNDLKNWFENIPN